MIYLWVVAVLVLFVFGLIWYFVNFVVATYIETIVAVDPTLYGTEHIFIVNLWFWLGAIMFISLLLWVYVNSQKPALPYAS